MGERGGKAWDIRPSCGAPTGKPAPTTRAQSIGQPSRSVHCVPVGNNIALSLSPSRTVSLFVFLLTRPSLSLPSHYHRSHPVSIPYVVLSLLLSLPAHPFLYCPQRPQPSHDNEQETRDNLMSVNYLWKSSLGVYCRRRCHSTRKDVNITKTPWTRRHKTTTQFID